MTTHEWVEDWCPRCGCKRVEHTERCESGYRQSAHPTFQRYYVVGDSQPRDEEPPCAGWEWLELPDVVETPLLIAGVKLCTSEPVAPDSRFAVLVNRRWRVLDTDVEDVHNQVCHFRPCFAPLGTRLQALLHGQAPTTGRVRWLARRVDVNAVHRKMLEDLE